MIEGGLDQQPRGIRAHPHLLMTPPWVVAKTVQGQASKQPISVYTALPEMDFVPERGEGISSPSDPDSDPSPLSPISLLQFAPPEDITALVTPTEPAESPPRGFPLQISANPAPPGQYEKKAWVAPSEQFTSPAHAASVSPQQSGLVSSIFDEPASSASRRVGRPLPELPEQPPPRPLPLRPVNVPMVTGCQGFDRFSYPPVQEFVRGSSKNRSVASRPVSDSGPDTRTQPFVQKEPKLDPTPEDSPQVHHIPVTPTTRLPPAISSVPDSPPPPTISSPSPTVTVSTVFPTIPKLNYPAPILPDLRCPTSIDLVTAAGLSVTGENGEQILFGALFRDRKVVVIFIRHFWCLFCHDYVRLISNNVIPEVLWKKGVDLIVIGNGAPGMIKAYKSMPSHCRVINETNLSDPRNAEAPLRSVYRSIQSTARCPRAIQNQWDTT